MKVVDIVFTSAVLLLGLIMILALLELLQKLNVMQSKFLTIVAQEVMSQFLLV